MWGTTWWCNFTNKKNHHHPFSLPFLIHPQQNLLPIQLPHHDDDDEADAPINNPISTFFNMIFSSWLRRSASIRYLILALCSPLLLPLFCAIFPFLCALEVFFRLCCRRRRRRRTTAIDGDQVNRSSEEDGGVNGGERLLQRYLEDQLILVAGSVYYCGDNDDDYGVDVEYFDNRSPLLQ